MYKCCNCDRTFDEPRLKQTTYEFYYGAPISTHTSLLLELCPFCGSDEVEEKEDEDELV